MDIFANICFFGLLGFMFAVMIYDEIKDRA